MISVPGRYRYLYWSVFDDCAKNPQDNLKDRRLRRREGRRGRAGEGGQTWFMDHWLLSAGPEVRQSYSGWERRLLTSQGWADTKKRMREKRGRERWEREEDERD